MERGLAVRESERCIRMMEADHRFSCEAAGAHSPRLVISNSKPHRPPKPPSKLEGFLPYPQPRQTSSARGLRAKFPGLAKAA